MCRRCRNLVTVNTKKEFVNQVIFGAWIGMGVCGLLSQIFWPGWVE